MSQNVVVQALNKFEVVDRPALPGARGKFDELLTALKNLANDKAIKIRLEDFGYNGPKSLQKMRAACSLSAKRFGFRVKVAQGIDGQYYVWGTSGR